MVTVDASKRFSPERSLRARMLVTIATSVMCLIAALIWVGAARIRHMSVVQIRHEGLLLADTVAAAVGKYAVFGNEEAIQEYIDALVARRQKNDLEVNVTFLRGDHSDIVASNVPDNVEMADEDEHEATLMALATGKPDLEIEVEEGPEDDVEEALANDPSHPDYYFPEDSRLLSITTPLIHSGQIDLVFFRKGGLAGKTVFNRLKTF